MRRFRRKSRGVWLPNIGTQGPEAAPQDDDNGVFGDIILDTTGKSKFLLTELTFDHYVDEGAASDGSASRSIADFVGSEYFLDRIVGKCFIALQQVAIGTEPFTSAQVTAGFFIAREDESGTVADATPIGAQNIDDIVVNYAPTGSGLVRAPWIWRRQWILGNQASAGATGSAFFGPAFFPPTNAGYGSIQDGPHLDAKTKRRVRKEDRLWFIVQARGLGPLWSDPFNTTSQTQAQRVSIHLDYRLHGALRKARSTGRF